MPAIRWPAAVVTWWSRIRTPRPLGYRGERAAERYLRRLGYKIVARAMRMRGGELDLVAVDGRTLVFVEVKTRTGNVAGDPAEAVDDRKQRRVTRAALVFMKRHGLLGYPGRFDVVAVTWPDGVKRPVVEHYRGAFEAQGAQSMFA